MTLKIKIWELKIQFSQLSYTEKGASSGASFEQIYDNKVKKNLKFFSKISKKKVEISKN